MAPKPIDNHLEKLSLGFRNKSGRNEFIFWQMTRKEFMDQFFDLCKEAQEEIPPQVIAEILRDYAERLDAWTIFT